VGSQLRAVTGSLEVGATKKAFRILVENFFYHSHLKEGSQRIILIYITNSRI
jgi:hypothetical protein